MKFVNALGAAADTGGRRTTPEITRVPSRPRRRCAGAPKVRFRAIVSEFLGAREVDLNDVARKTTAGTVVHPEQKIGRDEALKAYTINGAYMVGAEKVKGSIETGKVADLVVLDRDYLTCPEDDIARIEPVSIHGL